MTSLLYLILGFCLCNAIQLDDSRVDPSLVDDLQDIFDQHLNLRDLHSLHDGDCKVHVKPNIPPWIMKAIVYPPTAS